ncbi:MULTISPECIES: response regulator [unclassified Rhizobium]|uniref:response regulator n=1 Tax=unclassified Rhizobium TaxID=2613769 RepID=UPI001FD81356|nr:MULTISPECIES: response regulator [unclassified Rhizobium]
MTNRFFACQSQGELEHEAFVVFEARTADEAIAVLEGHRETRLAFTDVNMPGSMHGLKFAPFVPDRWPPIKIIVTSGYRQLKSGSIPEVRPSSKSPTSPPKS